MLKTLVFLQILKHVILEALLKPEGNKFIFECNLWYKSRLTYYTFWFSKIINKILICLIMIYQKVVSIGIIRHLNIKTFGKNLSYCYFVLLLLLFRSMQITIKFWNCVTLKIHSIKNKPLLTSTWHKNWKLYTTTLSEQ